MAGQPGQPGQAPPDPAPADPGRPEPASADPGRLDPARLDPALTGRRGVPQAEPADGELLRRHISGDREAFGLLFLRHRERLWAVAVRTLVDPEEAADALQDAMISAFRRAADFRGESAVTTWLHRIVVNACLDRLRRRAARPTASGMDEQMLDVLARGSALADHGADRDTALDVLAALRTLVPEQRAALVLVDMLGYPVADTAEILGISIGTVKSRCARGRARLLPLLAHLHGAARNGPGNRSAAGRNRPATARVSPPEGAGDGRA